MSKETLIIQDQQDINPEVKPPKAFNRRGFMKDFAKGALAVYVGLTLPSIEVPIEKKINEETEKVTGHLTGNAAVRDDLNTLCGNAEDKNQCYYNYIDSKDSILPIVVKASIEEVGFRLFPSMLLSEEESLSKGESGHAHIKDQLLGGDLSFTRREFQYGLVSSLIFGAAHNITSRGIDTNTIPASQTVGGMAYWYLQRKLGFFSNVLAHSGSNARIIDTAKASLKNR